MINRWDVEGYFQQGCADEAQLWLNDLKKERCLIIRRLSALIMFMWQRYQ